MRREDISDALGMLDEELLQHTDLVRNKVENQGKRWKSWYAMAAGICLICLVGAVLTAVLWANPTDSAGLSKPDSFMVQGSLSAWGNDEELRGIQGLLESLEWSNLAAAQEPFVPISDLLGSPCRSSEKIMEMAAAHAKVPIEEYTGIYEKVYPMESAVLAASIGREVDGAKDWYYISGHSDLQYLIQKDDQNYSLWQFGYFDCEEYPYIDVLKLVYRIESAEDITEIEVKPATMDNTDAGKRIQKEIGTRTVTNRDEIETIYQVLCTMTCYGSNRWDLIDYGDVEAPADTEMRDHNAVRLGRYLAFATDYGNVIDGLKYTAVSGMFYEFSGVAYNRLTREQAESVSDILGIGQKAELELEEGNLRTPRQLEQGDNPSDNSGKTLLSKAENTSATLEQVTELQTRVSNAMVNRELPFVVVSAVYENPYRLHVVVTTDSEDELEKLRALDTEGGILEIEYAPDSSNGLLEKLPEIKISP